MRPPNSPDLNPVDYAIWSVIQLDAAGNILTVHYKDMKYDVSFSLGNVSMLFRWGEHFCHICVKCFLLFTTVQKIIKIDQDFPELWSQMFCHLFMVHSVELNVNRIICIELKSGDTTPVWHSIRVTSYIQNKKDVLLLYQEGILGNVKQPCRNCKSLYDGTWKTEQLDTST